MEPLKVRRIRVEGALQRGVYAKDVILKIIQVLGVKGGVGYAYEYAGSAVDAMSMDERMTICNMSIEGGARVGYVNPDETTFAYMEGRPFAPHGEAFERAKGWWRNIASDPDARYDDDVELRADTLSPVVTWGLHPGQSVGVDERVPRPGEVAADDRPLVEEALAFMGFAPGQAIAGTPIDVAFVGSCTNARLSDLREAARFVRGHKVASVGARAGGAGVAGRARGGRGRGPARDLHRGGFRLARLGVLDVPRDESRQACRVARSAPRRPTATSRAGRGVRRGARCS